MFTSLFDGAVFVELVRISNDELGIAELASVRGVLKGTAGIGKLYEYTQELSALYASASDVTSIHVNSFQPSCFSRWRCIYGVGLIEAQSLQKP